jgi:tetratricopeptide (TPR) repeat protein
VTTTNPEIVDRLLDLLRRWGWETEYRQLEEQLAPAGMGGGESGPTEVRAFFLSWMAVERGDYATADRHDAEMAAAPELAGWVLFVRAFGEFRRQQYASAAALLDQAEATGNRDGNFRAAIAHVRGSIDYHRGNSAAALARLKQARDLLREQDPRHFGLGRVLDAMGMVYASTSNFHAAREFYLQALQLKRDRDLAGEALANGQLGRLCLDWGLLRAARAYFERDLEICDRIEDASAILTSASATCPRGGGQRGHHRAVPGHRELDRVHDRARPRRGHADPEPADHRIGGRIAPPRGRGQRLSRRRLLRAVPRRKPCPPRRRGRARHERGGGAFQ